MSGESTPPASLQREVALVELLDRALGAGVVVGGDVTLSLADVDLVELSLRLVVGSVPALRGEQPRERPEAGT
jgi:hypothetical protein